MSRLHVYATGHDISVLEQTKALVAEADDVDQSLPSSAAMPAPPPSDAADPAEAEEEAEDDDHGEGAEEEGEEGEELVQDQGDDVAARGADVVGPDVAVAVQGPELPAGRQPVRASRGRFEVTSRDRLFLQVCVYV